MEIDKEYIEEDKNSIEVNIEINQYIYYIIQKVNYVYHMD